MQVARQAVFVSRFHCTLVKVPSYLRYLRRYILLHWGILVTRVSHILWRAEKGGSTVLYRYIQYVVYYSCSTVKKDHSLVVKRTLGLEVMTLTAHLTMT